MMVKAGVGVAPWDVFAQGIAAQTGISFGQSTIVVSALVLLLWIPLKVKPGLGSILNAILIGVFADWVMPFVPHFESYIADLAMFLVGMAVVSFATGLYISCGMGKGPRDGLNVGVAQRFNLPFWQARTSIEVFVVLAGFLLGGQAREGTLIFALLIGYMNQVALKFFGIADKNGRV